MLSFLKFNFILSFLSILILKIRQFSHSEAIASKLTPDNVTTFKQDASDKNGK